MELKRDGWYIADKGKCFVLTEKGKEECASYRNKTVGEPVSKYETEAVSWSVENGYVVEASIPDWVVKTGYIVVYDYRNQTLHAGNTIVFPEREIAEKYKANYESRPSMAERTFYIKESVYEGKSLKECRKYEDKKVYNQSWYYGTDCLLKGDLVEEEIVDDIINCLLPACMRSDCVQLGEPISMRLDDEQIRNTYATFKNIAKGIWEYCGDCFRGENVQRGTEITY